MRIVCPSCAAEYEVPTARLKPGKLVRCARCRSSWLPDLHAEDAVPPRDPADEPASGAEFDATGSLPGITAMDRLAAAAAPPPRPTRLIGAWVLTFAVLAGAFVAVLGWRDAVVRVWPPSSRLLAATDQTAPPPGQITGTGQITGNGQITGKKAE
jgi:predicted Zn finger-like uncharacterized protein